MKTEKESQRIRFKIPGKPVGKGRPRAARRGKHIQLYTPEKTASYESKVALFAHQAMGSQKAIAGPVSVRMLIVHEVPASWSKAKRADALTGAICPTGKPDMDNVEKAILDAMNGIAYRDDAQVAEKYTRRIFGQEAYVTVTVTEYSPPLIGTLQE